MNDGNPQEQNEIVRVRCNCMQLCAVVCSCVQSCAVVCSAVACSRVQTLAVVCSRVQCTVMLTMVARAQVENMMRVCVCVQVEENIMGVWVCAGAPPA